MPVYGYKAIDSAGRAARGRLEAQNPLELEQRLSRMGLELVRAAPQPEARLGLSSRRLGRRDRIDFCFHLEQLAGAGIPLVEGLRDLRESVESPRLRQVAGALIESIEGGRNLSQALAEQPSAFDEVFVSLVRSGEYAGKLPEVLSSLGAQLRWEDELAAQTRKLLLYPAFVAGVVAAVVLFLLLHLVPQMAGFIRNLGHEPPPQTRALLWVSDLCLSYGWIMLAIAGVGAFAFYLLARHDERIRDAIDRWKIEVPIVGPILRKIILSRFASSFALMYGSGIMVLDALRHAEAIVGNRRLQGALHAAAQGVAEGRTLAVAFAETGLFPPLVIRMLRIGEHTGAIDTALQNVSYFYSREVREAIGALQALIEPVLTVALGAVLAWMMLAVLGPVYDTIAGLKL